MVIDIQSDGDALYTTSALWTAAHYRLPLLIVMDNNRVYNNRVYNNSMEHAVRMAEARGRDVGNRHVGTEIIDPDVDFAALARSFGIHAEGPILDPADLQARAGPVLRDPRRGADPRPRRPPARAGTGRAGGPHPAAAGVGRRRHRP